MTVVEPSVRPDPELAAAYLDIAEHRGGPRALERTALRTRSRAARDLLAHGASRSHLSADELVDEIRAARTPGAQVQAPALNLEWALSLARVMGMQNIEEQDQRDAVLLITELRRQHGRRLFDPAHQQTVVDRLWQAGEHALLRTWLPHLKQLRPDVRRYLNADLTNPFSISDPRQRQKASRRWQRLVDEIFTEHGIEPVSVRGDAATPFDGLRCEVDAAVDGPLVTVIMPVFRPGPELLTSVRSILAQTWRNLEILVMDDASPPGHADVLDACAALDERVQVHRMDENGGTYLARNAALDIATGELVTVQDADDWSHPRRIELQARILLEDPTVAATRSFCLRVSEDLVLQRPGYETSQENASSLMFRRQQALALVGYFDRSRKSADTEFRRRLELATGSPTVDLPAPLAVVRMAGGSLSRADFIPGWHHLSRYAYRAAYERWHAGVEQVEDLYLPRFPDERRFAIPQRFQVDQASFAEHPPHLDVVLLSDWRTLGPAQQALLTQVEVLTGAGYRVGIAHRESYLGMTARRQPLHPRVLDLMNAGSVVLVALDQATTVSLLVVRSPDVMQFAPVEASTLDVDRVVVVADVAPAALDGSRRTYDPAVCDANVRATFGTDPRWVAPAPAVRAALEDHVPADRLSTAGALDVVDAEAPPVPGDGTRGGRPVLGRRGESSELAWPATRADILSVYPVDGSADVRILGSADAPTRVLGEADRPSAWVTYRSGERDLAELLAELDFYAYFPHEDAVATLEPDVVRAVASGCVAILPPRYEPAFGGSAVYAEPAEVPALVRRLHEDRTAYLERSRRGADLVRGRFAASGYLAEVAELIGPPGRDPGEVPGPEPAGTTAAARTSAPRPRWSPFPGLPPGPELSVVLTVTASSAPRLGETLRRIRDDARLFGPPITVVHTPDARIHAREAALEHPRVRFVVAETSSRTDLAAAALAQLDEADPPYVCVAELPRVKDVRAWSRALHREMDRLRAAGLDAPVPLLVWTRQCSPQVVASYLARSLPEVGGPGAFVDYLGRLYLLSSTPRLEAVDPEGGDIGMSVWLAGKLPPDLAAPPWRYRVVLARGQDRAAALVSEAVALDQRADTRGLLVRENLRARLPVLGVADGTYVAAVDLDTEVEALRLRRRLRPAKGLLLSARTRAMSSTRKPGEVVRYLVHAGGPRTATFLTVQTGTGRRGRLRWAAAMARKDVGAIVRRRASRRMIGLRLARLATLPLFAGREIWLVGERRDTAQDNGLHLFRHLRRTQPGRHVYYVIDRDSPQRERVADLGNVVDHSSLRHQLLMLHADVLANAYSTRYLTPSSWSQESYVQHLAWRIGALRVYLKHGVHLNPNAVKRGISGYDMFLTVMRRESEAIRAVSGYDREIREIGMPRYDGLVPGPATRTILFMPTWRQYLVPRLSGRPNPGQIPFEGSAYERFISGFLGSPRLHELLERHDFRLTFLPHYNMASSFDSSVRSSDRIDLADTDATSFQDLLRGCDAFITDYSSVHFDVAYLGTPVIYARFDEADYEAGHASRSWFDYDRDGYGPVARTLDETLDALEAVLDQGCAVEETYAARVAESFTFRDRDNCARVVAAIEELSATRLTEL